MPDPMWRQIAEDLRQKIESGKLGQDGIALPSELELREEYDASRNTVRDAVKWLVTRGLIVTRPGQGTFVVKKIDPFIMAISSDRTEGVDGESASYPLEDAASRRDPDVFVPRIEILQATGAIAAELQLAERATIVSRHQKRFIDNTPWSLQTTFYPMRLVELGAQRLIQAEQIKGGAVGYIEKTLGVTQAGWRDRFTVRAPDTTESDFFKLPDNGHIAVFEITRTGYDQTGKPIRFTVTAYPADRNQFIMTVGNVPEDIDAIPHGG